METDGLETRGHTNCGDLDQAVQYFYSNNKDGGLFLISARESLEKGECTTLFEVMHAERHKDLILSVGWELVKIIFQFLPEVGHAEYNAFTKAMHFICSVCNPREICLSLSEIFTNDLPVSECLLLIGLFQTTCVRLEGKVAKIYGNFLTPLTQYLRVNNKYQFGSILNTTLALLKSRVQQQPRAPENQSEDACELRRELLYFLVHLLEFPLAEIDFTSTKMNQQHDIPGNLKTKNPCCNSKNFPPNFCENLTTTPEFNEVTSVITEYIVYLEGKCLKSLLSHANINQAATKSIENYSSEEEIQKLSYIGLGCLSYIVFVGNSSPHFLPCVLTGKHHFDMVLPYVITMLCNQHNEVVKKGLELFLTVIEQVGDGILDHSFTEQGNLFELATVLVRVTTHCEDSYIRQRAVKALRQFLTKFTIRAKYKILRILYQNSYHAGVAEFLILTLKAEIVKCLDDNNDWFRGEKLLSFLEIIFVLPRSVFESECGLVEEKSRILSTLNLYRFLLMKDNVIKMDSFASEVQQGYLKPLQDSITLGKARINSLIEENMHGKLNVAKDDVFKVSTPDGKDIDQASPQEQIQTLQTALLVVDMMESVLVRIREISGIRNNDKKK